MWIGEGAEIIGESERKKGVVWGGGERGRGEGEDGWFGGEAGKGGGRMGGLGKGEGTRKDKGGEEKTE